jgi:predicted double-glycine peptidase
MRDRSRIAAVWIAFLLFAQAFPVVSAEPAGESAPPVRDPEHIFQRGVTSWQRLRRQNVVMQERDFSCGAAALATLVRYYWGDDVTERSFLAALDQLLTREEAVDRIKNGLTLTDLRRAAVKTGYQASMGKLEFDKLAESRVPLVVGIKVRGYRHFVVFRGTDGYYVYLADPIRGNIRTPAWEFVNQWQENAILAVAKPGRHLPKDSPLMVSYHEAMLGESNKDVVEKHFLRPPVFFPLPDLP